MNGTDAKHLEKLRDAIKDAPRPPKTIRETVTVAQYVKYARTIGDVLDDVVELLDHMLCMYHNKGDDEWMCDGHEYTELILKELEERVNELTRQ